MMARKERGRKISCQRHAVQTRFLTQIGEGYSIITASGIVF